MGLPQKHQKSMSPDSFIRWAWICTEACMMVIYAIKYDPEAILRLETLSASSSFIMITMEMIKIFKWTIIFEYTHNEKCKADLGSNSKVRIVELRCRFEAKSVVWLCLDQNQGVLYLRLICYFVFWFYVHIFHVHSDHKEHLKTWYTVYNYIYVYIYVYGKVRVEMK